ncbi:MAG: iron-sulfur cluster assembly scaffold protein [Candidatus Micrarchaeia archaeon]
MDDFYTDEWIYNYEHPHNKGSIANPDAEVHEHNPVCGDDIKVFIKISKGRLTDIKFEGAGCVISMGTASMLTEHMKGKSIDYVEKFGVSDLLKFIGIDPGPSRLHCATISLRAIKEAVFLYEHKKVSDDTKKL